MQLQCMFIKKMKLLIASHNFHLKMKFLSLFNLIKQINSNIRFLKDTNSSNILILNNLAILNNP